MVESLIDSVVINDPRARTFILLSFARDGAGNLACSIVSPQAEDEVIELLHGLVHGSTN